MIISRESRKKRENRFYEYYLTQISQISRRQVASPLLVDLVECTLRMAAASTPCDAAISWDLWDLWETYISDERKFRAFDFNLFERRPKGSRDLRESNIQRYTKQLYEYKKHYLCRNGITHEYAGNGE